MSDVTYLKVNLFYRIFHPIFTTGILPVILLIVLNIRIALGILSLQVCIFNLHTFLLHERSSLRCFMYLHIRMKKKSVLIKNQEIDFKE